jgi:HD-GYP domain-containing protein (c-di-GMP phosphodiesterase class II)
MEQLLEQMINTLAIMGEKRDPYTSGHQKRVAAIAVMIAEENGIGLEVVKYSAYSSKTP